MPRTERKSAQLSCRARSNVLSPMKMRVGSTTRLNTKKAVPRWESCATKVRAIKVLDTAPTKRPARPLTSATTWEQP